MVAASSSDVSLLKGIQTKPISELRLELGIGRVGNVEDDDGGECRNQLRVRPRSRALALEGDAHGEGRTDGGHLSLLLGTAQGGEIGVIDDLDRIWARATGNLLVLRHGEGEL